VAKASARGRPLAPVVLSAPERAYLERQVRRRRVARRCRSAAASFCDVRTAYPASRSPLSLASMNIRWASGADAS
jgi:hypothetical protein